MAEYVMTIGKKETFYIGPADLSTDKRLEIPTQEFRFPQFIRIENFDAEIKEKIADFFKDKKEIKVFKSGDAVQKIHEIFLANKREYDEFDCE